MIGKINKLFSLNKSAGKDLKQHCGKWQLSLLILLLLLLPLLAGLQHHYLGKLSEAEKLRLKVNLELMAENFAQDFDSELTGIQQAFRLEEASPGAFTSQLQQAYLKWKKETTFPDLVRNIYLLEFAGGEPFLHLFDYRKGTFSRSDWPVELEPVKRMITKASGQASSRLLTLTQAPLLFEHPLIVYGCLNCRISDVIASMAPSDYIGYIIAVLNPDVIETGLIPALRNRHFSPLDDLGIDFLISGKNHPGDPFYVSRPELDADDFTNPEVRTAIGRWTKVPPVTVNTRVFYMENSFDQKQKGTETAAAALNKGKVHPPPEAKTLKIPVDQMVSWELVLRCQNNTLEGIVNAARQRNLLISYCILTILGISMVMVYISTRRANALARRQLKFVSGVSHELRTPLSVIRSAGENLADGLITDTDRQKKYGGLIRDEGRRLSTMVENILSFSALQNDKTTLNLRTTDIVPLLEACISGCPLSNDRQKPNIMIESDNKVPPANMDYDSMKIAFNNVIENALKYSSGGSPILIRIMYTSPGGPIEITFEDQGRGIDPEDLPHIFDPFFRGKNTEEQRTPGSGIGLSLVADIVKKHGGKIEVNSRRYKGTTVSIFLPAA